MAAAGKSATAIHTHHADGTSPLLKSRLELDKAENAASLLGQAQEVLDRFNHKHKNQHRLCKWWAEFDMLRRHTRKLAVDELQPAARELERPAPKRRKTTTATEPVKSSGAQLDAAAASLKAKAAWMSSYMIPHAYVAFSKLMADNQFAHLGLLLLGVLAQIHTAVSMLGGEEDVAKQKITVSKTGVAARPPPPPHPRQSSLVTGAAAAPSAVEDVELGVAVSRDEFELIMSLPSHGTRRRQEDSNKEQAVADTEDEKHPDREQSRPPRESPEPSETAALAKDKAKKKSSQDKKKKKKKKGDEFDDLFSGL